MFRNTSKDLEGYPEDLEEHLNLSRSVLAKLNVTQTHDYNHVVKLQIFAEFTELVNNPRGEHVNHFTGDVCKRQCGNVNNKNWRKLHRPLLVNPLPNHPSDYTARCGVPLPRRNPRTNPIALGAFVREYLHTHTHTHARGKGEGILGEGLRSTRGPCAWIRHGRPSAALRTLRFTHSNDPCRPTQ